MKHLSLLVLLACLSGCQPALYTYQSRPKMLFDEGIARPQPSSERASTTAYPPTVVLAEAGEDMAVVAASPASEKGPVTALPSAVRIPKVVGAETENVITTTHRQRRVSAGERLLAKRLLKKAREVRPGEKGKTSTMAILSTVAGVLGIGLLFIGSSLATIGIVFGVAALVLGIVSLSQIRRKNLSGQGWGIVGIVLGVSMILFLILAIVALAAVFGG